ncbi:hypothetical protein D3C71_1646570 [compost metagenome]
MQQRHLALRHDVENTLAQYRLGAFQRNRPLFNGNLFHQALERSWRLAAQDEEFVHLFFQLIHHARITLTQLIEQLLLVGRNAVNDISGMFDANYF